MVRKRIHRASTPLRALAAIIVLLAVFIAFLMGISTALRLVLV